MEHPSMSRRDWRAKKARGDLFFISFIGLVVFVLGVGGKNDSCKDCTDRKPPGPHTCEEQKMFGSCSSEWMIAGQYCKATCGRCKPCDESTGSSDSNCHCEDVQPGHFTCAEEKQFGKCDAPWMVEFGYCKLTCGRCTACNGSPGQSQETVSGFALKVPDSPPCTDKQPGQFTCEEEKEFGKCWERWMVRGNYCAKTCGRCPPEPHEYPDFSSSKCKCTDVTPPPGKFSCLQQREYGKCEADWMLPSAHVPEGYCQTTCGRCLCKGAPDKPEKSMGYTPVDECSCSDFPPPGNPYTCKQQREFGKCEADWMRDRSVHPEGYCQITCQRCPCTVGVELAVPSEAVRPPSADTTGKAPVVEPPETEVKLTPIVPPSSVNEDVVDAPQEEQVVSGRPLPPSPTFALPPQRPITQAPVSGLPPTDFPPTAPPPIDFPSPTRAPPDAQVKPAPPGPSPTLRALPSEQLLLAPDTEGKTTGGPKVPGPKQCRPTLEVLKSKKNLSKLTKMLEAGGLVDDNGNIMFQGTLLAPTNDAIDDALRAVDVSFKELLQSKELVPGLVSFLILTETIPSSELTRGRELDTRLGGTSPLKVEVTTTPSTFQSITEIFIVGPRGRAEIIEKDIPSCDLLIHVIDSLLLPSIDLDEDNVVGSDWAPFTNGTVSG